MQNYLPWPVRWKNELKQDSFWLICILLFLIAVLIYIRFGTIHALFQTQCEIVWFEKCEVVRLEERIKDLEMKQMLPLETTEDCLLEERIKELQPRLDPALRTQIVTAIMKYSEIYKLSPSLITALIWRETIPHFSPLSRSRKGAIGLMQVMYEVHKELIPGLNELKPTELYHIDNNVKYGCTILRDCIASTKNLREALKCYVGGDLEKYVNDIFRSMAEYEVKKYRDAKRKNGN